MKYFYIYCAESFANRYGGLISGITLSRLCGFTPKVIWHTNHMFRAEFYDIFSDSNNFEVLKEPIKDYFHKGKEFNLFSWDNNPYLNHFEHDINHHPKDLNLELFLNEVKKSEKSVFYYTPFLNEWIPKEEVQKTIESIKFNEEILNRVRNFIKINNLTEGFKGIHIRMTDNEFLFNNDDIDFLLKEIKERPSDKFFVCSDNPNIENLISKNSNVFRFKKEFKTEKLFPDFDWRLDDKPFKNQDGIETVYNVERGVEHCKETAIDFILLSQSDHFYICNYSTFSKLSKIIGSSIENQIKIKEEMKNKVAVFYHLYQDSHWERLYQEQINSLIVSGIYDECDLIHIGINGSEELPFILDKMKIQYNENQILEANTLQSLLEFCKENLDYKVLYFHSKGVTHLNNYHCEYTTNAWRIYLEYFVLHNWKTCIQDLDYYDCVGVEWENNANLYNPFTDYSVSNIVPHYKGNFWWANSSYISTLNLDYIYSGKKEILRYRSEWWIGTNNPKFKSYHKSYRNLYDFNYSPNYYIKNKIMNLTEELYMDNQTNNLSLIDTEKKYKKINFPKVFIITPCTRPHNLEKISHTIPKYCEWVVVFDSKVKHDYQINLGHSIKSPLTDFRGYPNKNFGIDYIKNELDPSDNDWIYILHDDNIIHPDWYENIQQHLNCSDDIITWGQSYYNGTPRIVPVDNPQIGNIDTSQYMVRWKIAKDLRYENLYEADGIYAEESANRGSVKKIDEYLGYYNFLRSHKSEREMNANICMISMFKNESKGIRRMLESVWRHIDFYVFQDNGSTDGTTEIVQEFFKDKNIPGFVYKVEEGWVGFGWNRDHLLQTTLRNDHGCDWIMKMDCDEYLEVDENFDWSPFSNKNIECFNVTAKAPGCIYYRTWIWNAKLPWKFYHDVAHECIYLDDGRGENYNSVSLPRGLRMIGTSDGESYTVRTKYISDALKLEEKLIREENMLEDLYHFWYVAKSYKDCYAGDFYPLGKEHSEEFARRFIFYFKKYIEVINAQGIHEMSYFSAFSIGNGYEFLGDYSEAIKWYKDSEKYCPERNEHIVNLALLYDKLGQHEKMLEQTSRLMDPSRKLPFPQYCFLLNDNIYYDSGDYPKYLHNYALSKVKEGKTINSFSINIQTKPRLWIVDNFYDDPYAVRDFAMNQEFEENLDYYKGNRSKQQFIVPGTKEAFEKIIGRKITNWTETHGMCGRFQYCTAQDDLVYHCDSQTLAGMVYLTPDAPLSCGTSLFAHKDTKLRNENDFGNVDVFGQTGFYDRTKFELVDTAGNVFNRLILFDAKCIHSANEYFGSDITNCRLFHLFFFD